MHISIVIPAYNEERRIQKTLEAVVPFLRLKKYEYEILVVDDGSSDRTAELVEEFGARSPGIRLLKNGQNLGKGYSVKRGVLSAVGDLIFFTDADLATPIEELEAFLAEIRGCDIVIGSRTAEGARIVVRAPVYREVLGRIFRGFVKLCGVTGFTDTQCGAKLFRKAAAEKIFPLQKLSRFAFDVELLYLAKRCGCSIKEVPIRWFHSADTSVRTLPDGTKMFFDLIRIKFLHRGLK
jgi:dolichyl-phosphate beta-glucosyltransferase